MVQRYTQWLDRHRPPRYYELLNNPDPVTQAIIDDPKFEIIAFDDNGVPIINTTGNLGAAQASRVDIVWSTGTTGAATVSGQLGIWDSRKVDRDHPELVGRVTFGDGFDLPWDHPTHVGGTMIASGVDPNAKGMSNQAVLRSFDWTNDIAEMAPAGALGMRVSNHSYGSGRGWSVNGFGQWRWFGDVATDSLEDYYFGFYSDFAQMFDQIAWDAPNYLIVKAAMNDRGDSPALAGHNHWDSSIGNWVLAEDFHYDDGQPSGYDCMDDRACAKNIVTVGAVEGLPLGYIGPSYVVLADFSNVGPTDDGRIKPDLVAKGVDVYSTLQDGLYDTWSGTSMATPVVSGSANLLMEIYEDVCGVPATSAAIKAVMLNTTLEAGSYPGPDYQFGWGLLNADAAATLIRGGSGGNAGVLTSTLAQGEVDAYYFTVDARDDIRLTLAWTDPPGTPPAPSLDPPTPMLVNDLGLRIEYLATSRVYEPWLLDPSNPAAPASYGPNHRDNVERIDLPNAFNGTYRVTVANEAPLANGSQQYSLAWSNLTPTEPEYNFAGTIYDVIPQGAPAPLTATEPTAQRGIYVTALRDFDIDAIGMKLSMPCQSAFTVRIYDATGTTAGALLAEATSVSVLPGEVYHYIPIDYTLQACGDYLLTFQYADALQWPYWLEDSIEMPVDVGGVMRVNDGALGSNATNPVLPPISVVGWAQGTTTAFEYDLGKPVPPVPVPQSTAGDLPYGAYITSLVTQDIHSIGWRADVPTGQPIDIWLYEATGTTRGALIGSAGIPSTGPGMRWHDVPFPVTLQAGTDYDLEVQFEAVNSWPYFDDTTGLPFVVDGGVEVRNAEQDGLPAETTLVHLRLTSCTDSPPSDVVTRPQSPPGLWMAGPNPNPVSGRATLDFHTTEAGPVRIDVFDVRGRHVATVLDVSHRSAGPGTATLDGTDLRSGMYFVRLTSVGGTTVRKVVVVR